MNCQQAFEKVSLTIEADVCGARRCTPGPRPESPRKKRDLTMDALVAATAVELAPSVVITAVKPDLELLVDGFDVKVPAV